MLGKLMKYEFKAMGRIFLPLFGALLVASAINRLFIALDFTIPKVIGTTISSSLIVAVIVVALILTIQRFYRNLLSREGYLMFTLPVRTDSLVWSKLLVAAVWMIVSLIVVMLAIAIMAATGDTFTSMMASLKEFFRSLSQAGFSGILIGIECVLLAIGGLFSGILTLYACIALSLFVGKHRVGFAFLMFIVINIIGQTILGILAVSVDLDSLTALVDNMSGFGQVQTVLGLCFLFELIAGGIFYVVTRLMLKYKLNLE
ncbi:hypothetical protein SAMN02745823_01002 [Sporobacter termitidis DSM 10068]|uniref:ABC-2 family transporter protein n=1 Tax=Sporobacter termitidis DSM 10068 TaxID=1123282 RepID=A0A1M5VSR4_9FIRM|nr:hypothetical protein [Sporobacter termitidis]SHH78228.1 hypothetical protein SAMN02745823_01002 [Sporobacter termitidis DSM 10068]